MSKYDLWVVDKDECPDDEAVIMKDHCVGCQCYEGFKMVDGQPCVACSFYERQIKTNK